MKERPICTYCGYSGHDIDKCYKLRGCPPRYKAKQKPDPNQRARSHTNQAIMNQVYESTLEHTNGKVGKFMNTLNVARYQHLMNMLSTHLTSIKVDATDKVNCGHTSGTCFSISLNPILYSLRYLVVDLGTTTHICFTKSAFHTLNAIQNAYITLPNHEQILVYFNRTVKISPELILEDVLFVPQFKLNLLPVSSLTGIHLRLSSFLPTIASFWTCPTWGWLTRVKELPIPTYWMLIHLLLLY